MHSTQWATRAPPQVRLIVKLESLVWVWFKSAYQIQIFLIPYHIYLGWLCHQDAESVFNNSLINVDNLFLQPENEMNSRRYDKLIKYVYWTFKITTKATGFYILLFSQMSWSKYWSYWCRTIKLYIFSFLTGEIVGMRGCYVNFDEFCMLILFANERQIRWSLSFVNPSSVSELRVTQWCTQIILHILHT